MHKFILSLFGMLLFLSSCNLFDTQYKEAHIDSNEDLQEYLLNGWNTWNNPNLLSYVRMPEGLAIQLSFRQAYRYGGDPYYLNQAYISSPFHNFPEKIEPIAHSYDGSYTELRIKWKGVTARVQSAMRKSDFFILYTPEELPENPPVMILETGLLWNKDGVIEKQEDFFQADFGARTVTIGATEPDSLIPLPLTSNYISFRSDKPVGIYTGKSRTLEYIQEVFRKRVEKINSEKDIYGELSDSYDAMHSVLAWNIIYDAFNNRAITPVSRIWNENWGGYVLFDWDTYFTAAMFAFDDKFHAFSNLIAITDEITDEGFIPNYSGALSNGKSEGHSQPPVGSLITRLIYDKYPDKWVLEEVYDNLLSWNRWWEKNRDNDGYLSWGSKPVPGVRSSGTLQGAKFESGLDNSPLFDEVVYNEETHLMELGSVGLMSLYIADCKSLSEIARILEKEEDAIELEKRAEKYAGKLETMWDEKSGIYRDYDLIKERFSTHLAPTNFYPLLAGVPSQAQAETMIQNYFMNPSEFYGEFMMPSISRSDPAFPDNDYWRGRIWAPMNFLVYLGLRNYDLPEARQILAEKSNALLLKEWKENRRVFENYNADSGLGSDLASSDGFYSWGGLLALIALMEDGYWEEISQNNN